MFIERVNVEPPDIAQAVDVVVCVERAELPLRVAVERAEEIDLNDDPAFARLRDEIFQPAKVALVPSAQIEFVPAVRISACRASRPRRDIPTGAGAIELRSILNAP